MKLFIINPVRFCSTLCTRYAKSSADSRFFFFLLIKLSYLML